ncbi:MAG: hypothetical protein MJY62_02150 [Bacteroidales bacterium]|nr:hypothetical protein [Bacteroidales bacterium]
MELNVIVRTVVAAAAASVVFSCAPSGHGSGGDEDLPVVPDGEYVLTSQRQVDAFARKTAEEDYPVIIKSLTLRGKDITDISSVAVNEIESLTIEGTAIEEISNSSIETVYDNLTIRNNASLRAISTFMASKYSGDIVIENNAALEDVSFLVYIEKIKGSLIIRGNASLGEDKEGASPTYGLNTVLSLLEDGIIRTGDVVLENNHPTAAVNPMQIGRLAHVSRIAKGYISSNPDYQIKDGKISETVLNNFLHRSITEAEYLNTETFNADGRYGTPDDGRMLLNTGAKLIGRAMYEWGKENYFMDLNIKWFDDARNKIDEIHAKDPDVFFQACLFEIVTEKVDRIPVPYWVFEAFGHKPEKRNFSYSAMIKGGESFENHWGTGKSVPNMCNEETQMWFYYKAVRFMEIGIEALHSGQINLMSRFGDSAAGFPGFNKVFTLIRQYAKEYTRRGIVLIDAHCSGYISNGVSLLDYCAYPIRLKEVAGSDHLEAAITPGYLDSIIGKTIAATTPSGWFAKRLPYIVELDNFGTSAHEGTAADDIHCWGYDEISWFSNCSDSYEKEFVTYAVNWFKTNDPMGHLEMPGLRGAAGARPAKYPWATTVYRCNTSSSSCTTGRNLESTIKSLWESK